jgi:hypothetical protein
MTPKNRPKKRIDMKKWTPAARAAFARKMKAARLAKRGGRAKNPKRRRRSTTVILRPRRKNARRKRAKNSRARRFQVLANGKVLRLHSSLDKATLEAYRYHAKHPASRVEVRRAA